MTSRPLARAETRPQPLRLGVLDFNWIHPGQSAAQALTHTFTLAKLAEALGFARYWVGEHHLEGHTTGSPELLAALLAASTKRIRVGIGALLLGYYSPLKIAEDFRLLETLFGRIDLGLGRGRADDDASHLALLDGRAGGQGMIGAAEYEAKLDHLVGFLRGRMPRDHALSSAVVNPDVPVCPEVWVCGSTTASVQAARIGASFCCTLFHASVPGPELLRRYREQFVPSSELVGPQAAVAVCGVCAEREEDARAIRASFPSTVYRADVVGSPEQCRAQLLEIQSVYDTDEILFLDISPTFEARERSYRLLAEACRIAPSSSAHELHDRARA